MLINVNEELRKLCLELCAAWPFVPPSFDFKLRRSSMFIDHTNPQNASSRQVATEKSGDRSPHSKSLAHHGGHELMQVAAGHAGE